MVSRALRQVERPNGDARYETGGFAMPSSMGAAGLMAGQPPQNGAGATAQAQIAGEPVDFTNWDSVSQKLVTMAESMYNDATGLNVSRHRKIADYRRRRDGLRSLDADNSGLQDQGGFYLARIGQLIDAMKALNLPELIPDPSSMDFVQARAKFEGMEEIAEKFAALMQENFRRAMPEEAPDGMMDAVAAWLDDFYTTGMCFSIANYEFEFDDEGNVRNDAATPQYIDPANLNPGQLDTHDPTYYAMYAPINEDEIHRMEIPDGVRAALLAHLSTGDPKRDPRSDTWSAGTIDGDWDGGSSSGMTGWSFTGTLPRRRIITRWPYSRLRQAFGPEADDMPREKLIGLLAQNMEWRPDQVAAAANAEWWNIEEDSKSVLIKFEPWPTPLPKGYSPVRCGRCFPRNGRFWAHGLYDRGGGQEKLLNFFHNAECAITALAADPPYWIKYDAIKATWRQENGNRLPPLTGGTAIPIKGDFQGDPWGYFVPGSQFMAALEARRAGADDELREEIHGSKVIEGQQNSNTATEDANKTQQGLAWMRYVTQQYRRTFLEPLVRVCYVIKVEALKMMGQGESVPSSQAEQQLRTITINPADLENLDYVDVYCAENNGPGGRLTRIQGIERWAAMCVPWGVADLPELAREYAKAVELSGRERVLKAYSPEELMTMLANGLRAYGPNVLAMLPPAIQQQIMPMLGMGGLMPGGAGGPGGGGGVSPMAMPPGQSNNLPAPGGFPGQAMNQNAGAAGGVPAAVPTGSGA